VIEKIIECQRKWVYLENIFSAPDIKKQLMTEAAYFVTADKFLKNLTKKLFTKPLINRLIRILNVLVDLTKIL
jgi:dynein heavy chain